MQALADNSDEPKLKDGTETDFCNRPPAIMVLRMCYSRRDANSHPDYVR